MKNGKNQNFAVLGLGRFGVSIVQTLADYDVSILACDRDETRLHLVTDCATRALQADLSDEATLVSLGLGNFDVVIMAMGEEFEASVIATMVAKENGAKHVIVKAINHRQKKILENIGADEVILPEHEMGAKVARRVAGSNIVDILKESDFYTISEISPMPEWVGKSIREADIRRKHGMTVLAIRRNGQLKPSIQPDDIIEVDDLMIAVSERKPR